MYVPCRSATFMCLSLAGLIFDSYWCRKQFNSLHSREYCTFCLLLCSCQHLVNSFDWKQLDSDITRHTASPCYNPWHTTPAQCCSDLTNVIQQLSSSLKKDRFSQKPKKKANQIRDDPFRWWITSESAYSFINLPLSRSDVFRAAVIYSRVHMQYAWYVIFFIL